MTEIDPAADPAVALSPLLTLRRDGHLLPLLEGKSQAEVERLFEGAVAASRTGAELLDPYHLLKALGGEFSWAEAEAFHLQHTTRVLICPMAAIGLELVKLFAPLPGIQIRVMCHPGEAESMLSQLPAAGLPGIGVIPWADSQDPGAMAQAVFAAAEQMGGLDLLVYQPLLVDPGFGQSTGNRYAALQAWIRQTEGGALAAALAAAQVGCRTVLMSSDVVNPWNETDQGSGLDNTHGWRAMLSAALYRLVEGFPVGTTAICWRGKAPVLTLKTALSWAKGQEDLPTFLTPRQMAQALFWLSAGWCYERLSESYASPAQWIEEGHLQVDLPGAYSLAQSSSLTQPSSLAQPEKQGQGIPWPPVYANLLAKTQKMTGPRTPSPTHWTAFLQAYQVGAQDPSPPQALPPTMASRVKHPRRPKSAAPSLSATTLSVEELKPLGRQGKLNSLIEGKSQAELEANFASLLRPDLSGVEFLDPYHFARLAHPQLTYDHALRTLAERSLRVFILGGGAIGLAVAKVLAEQPQITVALSSRRTSLASNPQPIRQGILGEMADRIHEIQIEDDTDPSSYAQAVVAARDRLGGLDVLFLGLGLASDQDFLGAGSKTWQERLASMLTVLDVNQTFPVAACMAAKEIGVPLTFLPGSIHGKHLQDRHVVSYGMTKSALEALARDWQGSGQAICWAGDYILTPMTARVAAAVVGRTKAGFFLTPRQVAEAVVWLTAFWRPDLLEGFYSPQQFRTQGLGSVDIPGSQAARWVRGETPPLLPESLQGPADYLSQRYPLSRGTLYRFTKTIGPADVAEGCGLWPLGSRPGERSLAQQGQMFLAYCISAALGSPHSPESFGTRMPGAIYLRQSLQFTAENGIPWGKEETVQVIVQVLSATPHPTRRPKALVTLSTEVSNAQGVVLAEGQAEVLVECSPEQWERLATSPTSPPPDPSLNLMTSLGHLRPLPLSGLQAVWGLGLDPPAGSPAHPAPLSSGQADLIATRAKLQAGIHRHWKRLPGELFASDFPYRVTFGGIGLRAPATCYSNRELIPIAQQRRDLIEQTLRMYRGAGLDPTIEPYNHSRHFNLERFESLKTGMAQRYWVSPGESIGPLAADAARQALTQTLAPLPFAALDIPGMIDYLGLSLTAVATHGGDYDAPGLGVQVNQHLGLTSPIPTLSDENYCTGFHGALYDKFPHVGIGLSRLALMAVGEVYSTRLRPDQPGWAMFGDLAVATTLTRAQEGFGIHWLFNQTNSAPCKLDVPGRGLVDEPLGEIMWTKRGGYYNLKGPNVGVMAGYAIVRLVQRAWDFIRSGLHQIGHQDPDRMDWYIFHQANEGLILKVTDTLGIPREKILWSLHHYANTSAASTLAVHYLHQDKIKPGDLVFHASFGGAFSWCGMLLTWGGSQLQQDIHHSVATVTASAIPVLPVGHSPSRGEALPRFMSAWGIEKDHYGQPAEAIVESLRPLPELGARDVLIQVMAAGINFNACWAALGIPVSSFTFPRIKHQEFHTLGSDASGIVVAKGSQVQDLDIGDAVVMSTGADDPEEADPASGDNMEKRSFHITGYECPEGTFAQFVRLDQRQALPKPQHLSWEKAASYMLVGATAWRAATAKAPIQPGHTVLIWGGSKGTGLFAVQIARLRGARDVVAVVSNEQGAAQARQYGATAVLNRRDFPDGLWGEIPADAAGQALWQKRSQVFLDKFCQLTEGRRADVVIEHPGAKTYPLSFLTLKDHGLITHFAATTGYKLTFMGKDLQVSGQEMLDQAGLSRQSTVLVYGADRVAQEVFERIRQVGAQLVVVVRGSQEAATVRSWDPEGATIRGCVDLTQFPLPADMPEPPHPDLPPHMTAIYEDYRTHTLTPFREAVRQCFPKRAFPTLVVERAGHTNTLDLSVFTVKPHGAVVYVESTLNQRYVFDARFVWMFQKKILPWIIGSHYASHAQVKEWNRLVTDGIIAVPDVAVFEWADLPKAHQQMLVGKLDRPKAVVRVGTDQGRSGQDSARPMHRLPQSLIFRRSPLVSVTPERIREMTRLSGDSNSVHQSDEAAQTLGFKGKIAHGMLVGSLINSFVAGLGWFEYVTCANQDFTFIEPVYIGDELCATVEVTKAAADGQQVFLHVRTTVERRSSPHQRWRDAIVGSMQLRIRSEPLDRASPFWPFLASHLL